MKNPNAHPLCHSDRGYQYTNRSFHNKLEKAGMTQSVFAAYMGVSPKTVEAWECGRTHPTGPVFRLLDILTTESLNGTEFVIAK